MIRRDDPTDLLNSPLFSGVTAATRPGFMSVSARAIPIGRPLPTGNVATDAAAKRIWRGLTFDVPSDDASGTSGADVWQAMAAKDPGYARESQEVFYITNPEQKPEGFRFTLTWRRHRDELGEWWVTPSGKIMLNAKFYTPPAPEAAPAPSQPLDPQWSPDNAIYRRRITR